jgi:peptidoglycan/xylan/chitin deacetylase (PgdA/CDA1 family)
VIRPLAALALAAALLAPAPARAQRPARAAVPPAASPAAPGGLAPNEVGRIMILEYHKIDYPEERWTRTPENFRKDLERLHAGGYRLVNLNDVLDGRIDVPAGKTPVVLTFDDSSPGQFRYLERDGRIEIDPRSGLGILEAFIKERPDFGRAATFFVLPGASKPNRLFNQPEHEGRKLKYLVAQGYEIGNHTLWHANLGKYDEATVRGQIAEAQVWIQRHLPDYRTRTLALPHGVYPRELGWALKGSAKGTTYQIDAILMVAGGAAPSPFARTFDPVRLPRIQAVDRDLNHWFGFFERHPEERYVSDGDPGTVAVPAARRDRLRAPLPRGLRTVER